MRKLSWQESLAARRRVKEVNGPAFEYESARHAWQDIKTIAIENGDAKGQAQFANSITDEVIAIFPIDAPWTPELEAVCNRYAFELSPGLTCNVI